jgi:Phytanoyl-CoA dioxygenase (PhyH)
MDPWFHALTEARALADRERRELIENGFVVVPGPVPPDRLPQLIQAYEAAVTSADPADVHVGRTTTRVTDFVNRDPLFDPLYLQPSVLDAAYGLIRRPFRLSTMHARTLRPHAAAQELHVDFERAVDGWPMLGFIYMIDEFRPDNGATRFVPGSQEFVDRPDDETQAQIACGPAGSMILFNGSVWHGHSANSSAMPRRSIQGAYIRREAPSGSNLPERMQPDTLARITPLARYLIGV